jgi:hypothetical protein
MISAVWDALDAAIPRLQADERYADYLVALASSPNAGKEGHNIANSWREMAIKGLSGFVRSTSNGVSKTGGGSQRSLKEVIEIIKANFGPTIRD